MSALDRFAEKIALTDNGCIEWTASLNNRGYGQFWRGKVSEEDSGKTTAHRWSYEYHVGPIPEGLSIDHLCRNRACVNPDHLEPVTTRENLLRGEGPTAIHARKTHCPANHPYAGENLLVDSRGRRGCRTCRAQYHRDLRRRRSSATPERQAEIRAEVARLTEGGEA